MTNSEGNHGEDVKDYYFYVDSTLTHSYMKYLYKYPQRAVPYDDLLTTNRQRSRNDMEYELIDTGIFNDDRYFDIFVEYAKETPQDVLINITIWNRGPAAASLHVLPTVWFRNTWSWSDGADRPTLKRADGVKGASVAVASHAQLGERFLYCEGNVPLLFTENETNNERLFGVPNRMPYVKDGVNNYIVHGQTAAVNPAETGTKTCAHYEVEVGSGECKIIKLRLTDVAPKNLNTAYGSAKGNPLGTHFDEVVKTRRSEADEFYASITPPSISKDEAQVMRQALAGMLWSKQYYYWDADKWLKVF